MILFFFFFKQKTAYEMRISDWSSDVCSSDLLCLDPEARAPREWEWYIPWPAPEIETFATDPRIAQVQSIYENWLKHAPQLADIQRMDCTQPGECNHGKNGRAS